MKRRLRKTLPSVGNARSGPVSPPPLLIRSPRVFPEAPGVAPQCHLNLSEAVSFPRLLFECSYRLSYFWMFNLHWVIISDRTLKVFRR